MMFANALFNTWISDPETCFKPMPLALSRDLDVRSAGFGAEAEVAGKLLKRRQPPDEGSIGYKARQREQGKNLTWRDGVEALWILIRVRLEPSGGLGRRGGLWRPSHRHRLLSRTGAQSRAEESLLPRTAAKEHDDGRDRGAAVDTPPRRTLGPH
jgi:hypothetical protein